ITGTDDAAKADFALLLAAEPSARQLYQHLAAASPQGFADVAAAVARADAAGIPVVTLVNDLPNSASIAYAGADNRAAGETAAYLIGESL
ncbi:substrate-binding domain-containing protein, partial [Rhizobium johnstonii]|uniref:substrate-binding domain-containing protein n=1 Tax=Rhizobium johnstonii TaxID=3019933 RepID=UPI003F9C079A